jgi:hypothetical protein
MELWWVLRDLAVKSTRKSVERGPVRSVSLEWRAKGPLIYAAVRYLFIDDLVAGLHDTCSEVFVISRPVSLLYADDVNALSFFTPQWFAS